LRFSKKSKKPETFPYAVLLYHKIRENGKNNRLVAGPTHLNSNNKRQLLEVHHRSPKPQPFVFKGNGIKTVNRVAAQSGPSAHFSVFRVSPSAASSGRRSEEEEKPRWDFGGWPGDLGRESGQPAAATVWKAGWIPDPECPSMMKLGSYFAVLLIGAAFNDGIYAMTSLCYWLAQPCWIPFAQISSLLFMARFTSYHHFRRSAP